MPEKTTPILNKDASLAYIPFYGMLVNLSDAPATPPKTPIEKIFNSKEYVEWGDDNDFPGYVLGKAKKNTLIPSVNNFRANHMAAADLHYGFITGYDKNNKPIIQRFVHKEIDAFWKANNKRLFLQDAYRNLYWWHHAFVDMHMNEPKSRIVAVSVQDTMHCRFSQQNKISGNKDFVFIDANFPQEAKETTQQVRCIDVYHDRINQLRKLNFKRFIYPLFFNSPGRTFYQETPWHSIIESKWLDLMTKIPEFKSKLMDNQMFIKYVVHVPEDYWRNRYKDWDQKNQEQRNTARTESLTEFNNVLTGVSNAGKTIMLTFKSDAYQKQYGKWEVQELKGNLGEGAYIEDSQEASDHTLFSMAFDGTLIGKTPGKSQGAGSGSDKRLADEIFFKNNKPYSQIVAEPLTTICEYNGWTGPEGEDIIWFPEETILTTLNNVTPENRP